MLSESYLMKVSTRKKEKGYSVKARNQRGIVLMIALIVLVAMSLAGVALVRSVDTTTQIAGNLSFRQGVTQEADRGIEAANTVLINTIKSSNETDNPALNYFATRQTGESTKGIPVILSKKTGVGYPSSFQVISNATTKNEIRYVIERLCSSTGKATLSNCVLSTKSPPDGGDPQIPKSLAPPPTPLYRVTVRVDGPKNTVSFVQAMMR